MDLFPPHPYGNGFGNAKAPIANFAEAWRIDGRQCRELALSLNQNKVKSGTSPHLNGAAAAPLLAELKSAGLSARQMAAELTLRGIQIPTGARWHAQTVLRMIDRAGC